MVATPKSMESASARTCNISSFIYDFTLVLIYLSIFSTNQPIKAVISTLADFVAKIDKRSSLSNATKTRHLLVRKLP